MKDLHTRYPLSRFADHAGSISNSETIAFLSIAISILIAMLIAREMLARIVARLTIRIPATLSQLLVRLVRQTNILLLLLLSAKIASLWSALPKGYYPKISQATTIALILQMSLWASIFANQWFTHYADKKQAKDPSSLTAFGLLSFACRFVIWLIAFLIILENLGFNVGTLVAGLGIGGIAVALAVQNILGDLLGSLSIILDKPFVVGDAITIGEVSGTVEHIGVKTTRIRAVSGEQVVITNSDLLAGRIRNFKRLVERRVVFTLSVVYETPAEKLEAIPEIVRQIVEGQSSVRFDRAHLATLGNSALIFEVVYFVLSSEFNRYMDVQQAINFALLRRFKELEISFALPTQTLVFKGAPPAL